MTDGKTDSKRDKWLGKISDEDKAHKSWRGRAEAAEKAFCDWGSKDDEGKGVTSPEYPIFYTTINLIQGKINGRPPKPDVRKRHSASPVQSTPVPGPMAAPQVAGQPAQPIQPGIQQPPAIGQLPGASGVLPSVQPIQSVLNTLPQQQNDDNVIAICLERCLTFTIDTTTFTTDGALGVRDYLTTGLGNAKIEIETEVDEVPVVSPLTGEPMLDEDGEPQMELQIVSQAAHLRHFHWSQFRWEPAKDWRKVTWVAFDHFMTKDDIEDQFDVTLPEEYTGQTDGGSEKSISVKQPQMERYETTYLVHEVWDKKKGKRLFVSDCYSDLLDEEDDPLGLDNFFPCPPPMVANVNGRELVPCPDYWQYQYLAEQCNTLSVRLKKLTEQVKDIKFYDKSFGLELKQANDYPDGTFIAVTQLLDKLNATGGSADTSRIIAELDMKSKVEVLQILSQQLDTFKSRIYEINGISDIQRGVSNPNDTATAQNIKNEWADIRTGQRVQTVALWYRDIFRIMAELIATKFTKQQIQAMSGIQLTDTQLGIMRSDLATAYSVDVESDSTMLVNDSQNVQELTQFLQALEPLLTSLLPGAKAGNLPADLVKEILNLVVDTYKAGRDLQATIEALPSTLQQLNQMSQATMQAQRQAQQAQQQLQKYQQGEEARKNAQTQADVQNKSAQTQRTQAETQLLTPPQARKAEAEAQQAQVAAHQAGRQDVMDGLVTGIQ